MPNSNQIPNNLLIFLLNFRLETEKVNLKKEIEEKKVEIEAIDSDKVSISNNYMKTKNRN